MTLTDGLQRAGGTALSFGPNFLSHCPQSGSEGPLHPNRRSPRRQGPHTTQRSHAELRTYLLIQVGRGRQRAQRSIRRAMAPQYVSCWVVMCVAAQHRRGDFGGQWTAMQRRATLQDRRGTTIANARGCCTPFSAKKQKAFWSSDFPRTPARLPQQPQQKNRTTAGHQVQPRGVCVMRRWHRRAVAPVTSGDPRRAPPGASCSNRRTTGAGNSRRSAAGRCSLCTPVRPTAPPSAGWGLGPAPQPCAPDAVWRATSAASPTRRPARAASASTREPAPGAGRNPKLQQAAQRTKHPDRGRHHAHPTRAAAAAAGDRASATIQGCGCGCPPDAACDLRAEHPRYGGCPGHGPAAAAAVANEHASGKMVVPQPG